MWAKWAATRAVSLGNAMMGRLADVTVFADAARTARFAIEEAGVHIVVAVAVLLTTNGRSALVGYFVAAFTIHALGRWNAASSRVSIEAVLTLTRAFTTASGANLFNVRIEVAASVFAFVAARIVELVEAADIWAVVQFHAVTPQTKEARFAYASWLAALTMTRWPTTDLRQRRGAILLALVAASVQLLVRVVALKFTFFFQHASAALMTDQTRLAVTACTSASFRIASVEIGGEIEPHRTSAITARRTAFQPTLIVGAEIANNPVVEVRLHLYWPATWWYMGFSVSIIFISVH